MIAVRNSQRDNRMNLRSTLLLTFATAATTLLAQAPNKIWSYAIGDWRNGPVVTISPLFETTEAFTTPQLIARVKKDYTAFAKISDIDIQRFATTEEGELSRVTLKGKYEARKLTVNMLEAATPPVKEEATQEKQ